MNTYDTHTPARADEPSATAAAWVATAIADMAIEPDDDEEELSDGFVALGAVRTFLRQGSEQSRALAAWLLS